MNKTLKIILGVVASVSIMTVFQNCGASSDAASVQGDLALDSALEDQPSDFADESSVEDFQTSAMSTIVEAMPRVRSAWMSTYNGRPTFRLKWYAGRQVGPGKNRFRKFNLYIDGRYFSTKECGGGTNCTRTWYADGTSKGVHQFSIVGIDNSGNYTSLNSNARSLNVQY